MTSYDTLKKRPKIVVKKSTTEPNLDKPHPHPGSKFESYWYEKWDHLWDTLPHELYWIIGTTLVVFTIIILVLTLGGYFASKSTESATNENDYMQFHDGGFDGFVNINDTTSLPCPTWSLQINFPPNNVTSFQIPPSQISTISFSDGGCTDSYYYVPMQSLNPTIGINGYNINNGSLASAGLYSQFSTIAGQGQRIRIKSGLYDVPVDPSFSFVMWVQLDLYTNPNKSHILIGPNSDATLSSGPAILVNGTTYKVIVTDGGIYNQYNLTKGYSVSSIPLMINQTQMIVSTYNATNQLWSLYIDAIEVTSPFLSLNTLAPLVLYDDGLAIGNWGTSILFSGFQGLIGTNVQYYNQALNLGIIEQLFADTTNDWSLTRPIGIP